ncbi:MAG TPA: hypothetical protein VFC21_12120, partial [Bryobacteraceae bacterium]|nr:hypothetical protein [Bryobacteraceae bacterium]
LAFAAFTRNLIEIFGTAAVMLLGYALLMVSTPAAPQTQGTGIEWIADAASTLWGVAAVAVILVLQYRGRKTVPSRWTFGIASIVWLSLQFMPWQAAFAIQEKLSRESADAGPVRIAFAADRERSHRGPLNPAGIRFRRSIQEHVAFLYIPIRVDGLDGGRMLVADRAEVHVSDLSGKATDLAPIGQSGNFLASPDYQEISVLSGIYKNLKDQPLRMDIDYSLTLMQLNRQGVLPAAGADLWIPDLGRCSTGVNALRTEVAVHCVAPARPPCVTWSLESRNKAIYTGGDPCRTDYAPYADPSGNEFSNRFTIGFPFLDAAEEARLEGGRFLARVYRPVAHFTRRVSIPRIRLEDWAEEPGRGPGYYSPRYGAPE